MLWQAHGGALPVGTPTHDHASVCTVLFPPRARRLTTSCHACGFRRSRTRVIAAIPPSGFAKLRGKHDHS
jgi:hypothetical protein